MKFQKHFIETSNVEETEIAMARNQRVTRGFHDTVLVRLGSIAMALAVCKTLNHLGRFSSLPRSGCPVLLEEAAAENFTDFWRRR